MLIRDGATPITCSEDILEALDFAVTRKSSVEAPYKKKHTETSAPKTVSINLDALALSQDEKTICSYLKNEQLSASDLIEKTSWTSSLLTITLSELEMKNLVTQEGGSYRMRVG
jgi:predicted Rossmann fold nucleotide-binding protein DprA/Smf involved in DNA uptake